MAKLKKMEVSQGVYWVEAEEADLRILCGCPEDAVKHLMQRGLIQSMEVDGVSCESGPNAILLSDLPLQNGAFCNLAEFPVLQMLYRQGMLLPGHPNNTGAKPLLIGSADQIGVQMQYIYRGNYGLISKEEILAAGESPKSADAIMRMKLKFAFGRIHGSEELLASTAIDSQRVEIRSGVHIVRKDLNVFEITLDDEAVTIDLNLGPGRNYRSAYPLGFQNILRDYFAIVHSGQGDGWDVNRPCMASIVIFQGKIYLIDAGPNITYSLTTLGIGINEVEGIFHTHSHDDHFAGLPTLMRADHRIKYFATPLVRASVFKKLSALLCLDEALFADLRFDKWTDIQGLEVKPLLSPHPVETNALFFRTFWEGRYLTYAHLADIASLDLLKDMVTENDEEDGVSEKYFDHIRRQYLTKVELKKIDMGGGMIHGRAEDFAEDATDKIILAHQSAPLTSSQKEIGSSAPFGVVDVLIADESDNLRRFAFEFLRAYFPSMDRHYLRTLLNNHIVEFMSGAIIHKKGQVNRDIHLVITGSVEKINSEDGAYNVISAGGLVGERSGMNAYRSSATYRAISFVRALRMPAKSYLSILKQAGLHDRLEEIHAKREFLDATWLFGESLSPPVQIRIVDAMERRDLTSQEELDKALQEPTIFIVMKGDFQRIVEGRVVETIEAGGFFGCSEILFGAASEGEYHMAGPSSVYGVPVDILRDIPVVMWKLLETSERRSAN